MLRYILRPAAVSDLRRAYLWYEKEQKGLGEEFLANVHASLAAIIEQPLTHPVVHRETRRAVVRRFPYGLYFRILDDVVVVVACYHARRASRGWKRRR